MKTPDFAMSLHVSRRPDAERHTSWPGDATFKRLKSLSTSRTPTWNTSALSSAPRRFFLEFPLVSPAIFQYLFNAFLKAFSSFLNVFEMFRVSKLAAEVPEAKILSVFRVENPTLARDPVVTASWGRFPCFSPKFLWIFHGFSMRFHVIFHGFHWFLMGFQARTTLEAGVYAAVRDAMGSDCELDLWHGTSSSCVPNIVLNGFNRAYSGRSHGPPAPKASTFLRHFKACEWRHG